MTDQLTFNCHHTERTQMPKDQPGWTNIELGCRPEGTRYRRAWDVPSSNVRLTEIAYDPQRGYSIYELSNLSGTLPITVSAIRDGQERRATEWWVGDIRYERMPGARYERMRDAVAAAVASGKS